MHIERVLFSGLLFLFVNIFSSVQADDRWVWVDSNKDTSLYVDTNTMKYDPSTDKATVWALFKFPYNQKISQEIWYTEIDFTNNLLNPIEIDIYDKNVDFLYKESNLSTQRIIPSTLGEYLFNHVKKLCNRDEELEKYQKNQDDEAKNEKISMEKEKQQKKKIHDSQVASQNRNVLLGGIIGILAR